MLALYYSYMTVIVFCGFVEAPVDVIAIIAIRARRCKLSRIIYATCRPIFRLEFVSDTRRIASRNFMGGNIQKREKFRSEL